MDLNPLDLVEAGSFRGRPASHQNMAVSKGNYQLVPFLMALKKDCYFGRYRGSWRSD
jgi:hypothetical protein